MIDFLRITFSILLPPVAVFTKVGESPTTLWGGFPTTPSMIAPIEERLAAT